MRRRKHDANSKVANEMLELYRSAKHKLPEKMLAWRLHAAGMENFGRNGEPEELPLPKHADNELLARIDAVGVCFSDVKIIDLGGAHPRLYGRDLSKEPIIPGHEVSLTIVSVGEKLRDRFKVGERYIVQADIYYKGVGLAYGYMLPGGYEQYCVIGKEMLYGDDGCYLIPVRDDCGYAEAALTEPWACVEASYSIAIRDGIKAGGVCWFIGVDGARFDEYELSRGIERSRHPRKVIATGLSGLIRSLLRERCRALEIPFVETARLNELDIDELVQRETDGKGFDDIIVLGNSAEAVSKVFGKLARGGILNIVANAPMDEAAMIDVGRIHYDGVLIVGTTSNDISDGYISGRRKSEPKGGGAMYIIGVGGPMGQMHLLRAIDSKEPPRLIVATDVDDSRLAYCRERYESKAKEAGIEIILLNPSKLGDELEGELYKAVGDGGFDDIILLAPVPKLIEDAQKWLGENGVMNLFAGLPRGTNVRIDVSGVYMRGQRYVGSSGSSIADLVMALSKTEGGELRPNLSVAAIGGIKAVWEAVKAAKEGRFPGKIVIFPHIDIPLIPLIELNARLPEVASKLSEDGSWTKEAEEELLRRFLNLEPADDAELVARGPFVIRDDGAAKRLKDKVAIVTGAGQGLGEAIAMRLAKEGAHVVIADINPIGATAVAEAVKKRYGVRALGLKVDVTNEDEVEFMVKRTLEEFGRIDILVANAGILISGAITEFDVEAWRRVIDVNLVGYMICAKHVAKVMIEQRSGVIIQINSKSGKKGSYRNSAYASSKFGGIGLTQSLALELAPYGVRVNAICPGNLLDSPLWVRSLYEQYSKRWGITPEEVRRKYEEQVPLKRGCTYDDVCNAVVFLASDESSYITGEALNVDGGQEMGR
ncbi:MAG: hypothetical protein GDYSWBUE_000457 [Candidatus Fervidibacterota bacterium]